MNVSAKDKNSGKEQSIVIKASSGLSDEDIEKMVKDAEANAEDDAKFEELVKVKNNADMLCHATRKTVSDSGDKLSDDEKEQIEVAVKELEDAVKTENVEQAALRDNSTSKFPVMTFDKNLHDFGTIMDGEAQETVFSYTNTGEAPLVITEIKSTCGCTVPQDWSRAPLLPGESSQFTVKFNGKGMNKTSKTVTIKANTQRGTESVRISAFINKPGAGIPPAAAGPIIQ